MSNQGRGVFQVNSDWSSGNLIFFEKAVGRTATGDVLTIGTTAVTIGNTANLVDFAWYATGSKSFVLSASGGTLTIAGIDVSLTGDLTIDTEDINLGDGDDLEFGDSQDVLMRFSLADVSNPAFVLALDDISQQMHITDKGAVATDWARSAGTHPELAIHSNTTPITDYLAIGNHDGTTAYIDVVGGTTLQLNIAGAGEVTLTATAFSPYASGGNALGTTALMWANLFLAASGVINFNNGDVTLTHGSNVLTMTGGTFVQDDVTDTSSTITGSIQTDGGVGIAKALWVGTTSQLVGAITANATMGIAGLVTSTSTTGFRSNPTFVPDATRTNYALAIGNRVTELGVTMVTAGDQNLDPVQINLNIIGANPTNTSTLNGIYQQITHDTTAMANLRVKAADWTVTIGANATDAYVYQGELQHMATATLSGESICMSALTYLSAGVTVTADRVCALQAMISGDGAAATVTGDCFVAYIVNAGTVVTTDSIVNVRNQSAATAISAIELELDGTVTYAFDFQGTCDPLTTGGTDCTASGATDPAYTVKVKTPDGNPGYIRVWAAA